VIAIIPLAGPDFERNDGTVKAEFSVDGAPLLRRALETRPWWRSGALAPGDIVFVLHDSALSRRFADERLRQWYPTSRQVFLGDFTSGAALSTIAAVALMRDFDCPLVLDLCDILFDCPIEPIDALTTSPSLGGLAVTFRANDPKYSYLECDASGRAIRAREKAVISDNASAGVYFFRSAPVLLKALAHSMTHAAALSHNGLLYVCPLFNGVIDQGLEVRCVAADHVRDIHIDPPAGRYRT
jgi:hypothetical protein